MQAPPLAAPPLAAPPVVAPPLVAGSEAGSGSGVGGAGVGGGVGGIGVGGGVGPAAATWTSAQFLNCSPLLFFRVRTSLFFAAGHDDRASPIGYHPAPMKAPAFHPAAVIVSQ